MVTQDGSPYGTGQAKRNPALDYRRLLAALSGRASRLGSRDPEGAAQEVFRRSIENAKSSRAIGYYFADEVQVELQEADWSLEQLLAWVHAVLWNVVREELSRARFQREVHDAGESIAVDPGEDPLEVLIRRELQEVARGCFQKLAVEQQKALKLRAEGLKYREIAERLGENSNTVATWISRGLQALGGCMRRRTTASVAPRSGR
jgi:RNA polymerase sigma factor (sigma-70 family)